MVRIVKGIPSFLGSDPRQSHGSFHYSGDWREVSVKIDDGNLHLPPNEVLLRSKALTNEHDQLQARSGPSMGHESCWCLEDVLVSTSIVTFWRNSRLVRMTTQSRLMYPPASLLRKDDNEEDDIDEDIPEEYVLNKCRVLTIAEWPSLVLAIEYVVLSVKYLS